jgi:magnesium-transporting ATPase (P-type)
MGSDETVGLTEAAARLSRHGANQISIEKPPSVWAVALGQLRDPMNIMLVAVAVVSLVIGEVPTALLVALLVVLNVVLGTRCNRHESSMYAARRARGRLALDVSRWPTCRTMQLLRA